MREQPEDGKGPLRLPNEQGLVCFYCAVRLHAVSELIIYPNNWGGGWRAGRNLGKRLPERLY